MKILVRNEFQTVRKELFKERGEVLARMQRRRLSGEAHDLQTGDIVVANYYHTGYFMPGKVWKFLVLLLMV